jgi:hypothetical protein
MSALNNLQPLNLDWPSAPTSDLDPSGMSLLVQAQNDWFARVGMVSPTERPIEELMAEDEDEGQS